MPKAKKKTKTKKTVKKNNYSKQKFKLIFENSPIAIWEEDLSSIAKLKRHLEKRTVTNIHKYLSEHPGVINETFREFKIIDVNKAALTLYGAKNKKELVSKFGKTITKEIHQILVEEFTALLEGNQIFEAEFKSKKLDGSDCDVLMKVSIPDEYKNSFKRAIVTLQEVTARKKLERHLRKLAQLDGLTKLYNHNTINRRLESEFMRAKRYGSSLSCLMIDVDQFKVINDEFGHPKGDQVIKRVAMTLKDSIRQVDIVGRYGGDEFLVILPETKPDKAKIAASRIQSIFAKKRFQIRKGVTVGIALSIGISGYPSKGVKDVKDMLSQADKAMYAAKAKNSNS